MTSYWDGIATFADIGLLTILALSPVWVPMLFLWLVLSRRDKPKPPDKPVPDSAEYERMAALAEAGVMPVSRLVEYAESDAG